MHEEVVMAGTGGQGIMIMGQLLAHAAMLEGSHVVWFPSYGPEARGGTADCTVIISDEEIGSPITSQPNTLVGMHDFLFQRFQPVVRPGGMLIVNSSLIDPSQVRQDCRSVLIPANRLAEQLGSVRVANMIALGAYIEATKVVSLDSLSQSFQEVLPAHRHNLIPLNEEALRMGASVYSTCVV